MSFLDDLLSLFRGGAPKASPSAPAHPRCPDWRTVPTSTEARAWLRDNWNEYPFAGERFSKDEAAAMVEAVYRAGASKVTVSGVYAEPWRIEQECGPYAATILVTPKKGKKAAVMKALKKYEPDELGTKGGKLRAWWD